MFNEFKDQVLPALEVFGVVVNSEEVKEAGTELYKVLSNVSKASANLTADYFDTLTGRGFSREEALVLVLSAKLNIQEAIKNSQEVSRRKQQT